MKNNKSFDFLVLEYYFLCLAKLGYFLWLNPFKLYLLGVFFRRFYLALISVRKVYFIL